MADVAQYSGQLLMTNLLQSSSLMSRAIQMQSLKLCKRLQCTSISKTFKGNMFPSCIGTGTFSMEHICTCYDPLYWCRQLHKWGDGWCPQCPSCKRSDSNWCPSRKLCSVIHSPTEIDGHWFWTNQNWVSISQKNINIFMYYLLYLISIVHNRTQHLH